NLAVELIDGEGAVAIGCTCATLHREVKPLFCTKSCFRSGHTCVAPGLDMLQGSLAPASSRPAAWTCKAEGDASRKRCQLRWQYSRPCHRRRGAMIRRISS